MLRRNQGGPVAQPGIAPELDNDMDLAIEPGLTPLGAMAAAPAAEPADHLE